MLYRICDASVRIMKKEAFEILKQLEGSWWHKGRVYALSGAMRSVGITSKFERVLDVGAGYGGMLDFLRAHGNMVDAVELYEEAKNVCDNRGYAHVWHSLGEISESYNLVGAFDVVEHIQDDKDFLDTIAGVVDVGGYFIATVPAFQFLWSQHDEVHKHYRRYTVKDFSDLVANAGFDILYCKYWNTALFFPATFLRLCNKTGESSLNLESPLNTFFDGIVKFEAKILPYLPTCCGMGIVLIARRSFNK